MMEKTCDFPVFISVKDRLVRIYGAGTIALRRTNTLLEFGAKVTVTAPSFREEFLDLEKEEKITLEERPFVEGEILSMDGELPLFILACTDSPEVNDRVVKECRERKIPVNHAGDKAQNDFYFPAVVKDEDITIGLTAGGKDHKLVRKVAAALRRHLKELKTEQ